jgi:hypothetical protein
MAASHAPLPLQHSEVTEHREDLEVDATSETEEILKRDRLMGAGRQVWYFTDADLPWPDTYGPFTGHESLLVFNVSGVDADIWIDLYWSDREPVLGLRTRVGAERIECFHPPYGSLGNDADFEVPVRTQYAIRLRSSVPVVCTYARIECRPAFGIYTMPGWAPS